MPFNPRCPFPKTTTLVSQGASCLVINDSLVCFNRGDPKIFPACEIELLLRLPPKETIGSNSKILGSSELKSRGVLRFLITSPTANRYDTVVVTRQEQCWCRSLKLRFVAILSAAFARRLLYAFRTAGWTGPPGSSNFLLIEGDNGLFREV